MVPSLGATEKIPSDTVRLVTQCLNHLRYHRPHTLGTGINYPKVERPNLQTDHLFLLCRIYVTLYHPCMKINRSQNCAFVLPVSVVSLQTN